MVKTALHRLLQHPPQAGGSAGIAPQDLLVALHCLQQPTSPKENQMLPLKRIVEAIQYCIDQRNVYRQDVMAIVLQQLQDITPFPPLLMRTVLQTVARYPKLVSSGFITGLLSNLVRKQIWTDKRLWEGFVKCCKVPPALCPLTLSLSLSPATSDRVFCSKCSPAVWAFCCSFRRGSSKTSSPRSRPSSSPCRSTPAKTPR